MYLAIGVNLDGTNEALGLWIEENEGARFWLKVVTELKNRGVEDMLIVCCDGLKGFPEAIEAVFEKTVVQLYIVHMIRSSTRFVSYKDRKAVCAALKPIYTAPSRESISSACPGQVRRPGTIVISHEEELERLTDYVRGIITGDRRDYDVIATRELEALRRRPLAEYLDDLEANGLKLQRPETNTPRGVLDLLESLRRAAGMTKSELSQKSGISRGHLSGLLTHPRPRPLLDSVIRLAVALDHPLELAELPTETTPAKSTTPQAENAPSLWPIARVLFASVATGLLTSLGLYAIVRANNTDTNEGER